MKKIFLILFIVILLVPFTVFAQTYTVKDLSIKIDDSTWYVFTRDNIKNNPELDELEVSYENIHDFMIKNDVLLDAFKFGENDQRDMIEFFVVIKKVDNVANMHVYDAKTINNVGEKLKAKFKADKYDIYPVDKYKYVHLKYYDQNSAYNIDEYYTVINGYGYTILAQKKNAFTTIEENEFGKIIATTTYKYDANYEQLATSSRIWERFLIGAIVTLIGGGISFLFSKRKQKIKKEKEA